MEDVLREAKELEALGVKELNLIAQDTSRYGLDIYGEYKLHELIQKICAETKIPWIRLLYLYPDKITDELVAEMRDNPRVCKYADIPVQHISDKILASMNRHGDGATIRDCISRLRREIPDIVLRSTAIVGFPGESEEDFAELCEFVKEAQFDRFGAFTYSEEEGTAAAEFENKVDEQTKQDRYDTLMSVQLAVSEKKLEKMVGKKIEVLCEGFDTVAGVHFLYIQLAGQHIHLLRGGNHQLGIVKVGKRFVAVGTGVGGIAHIVRYGLGHEHHTVEVIVALADIVHHLQGIVHALRQHLVLHLQASVLGAQVLGTLGHTQQEHSSKISTHTQEDEEEAVAQVGEHAGSMARIHTVVGLGLVVVLVIYVTHRRFWPLNCTFITVKMNFLPNI